MKRRVLLLRVALALLFVVCAARAGAQAQDSKLVSRMCPTVLITSPESAYAGEPLAFAASIAGGDDPKLTPTYYWTVTAGTVTAGQGTSVITVDTTGLSSLTLTATVEVGGLGSECELSDEQEVAVVARVVCRCNIDSYGDISFEDEQARLDNFAIALTNEPTGAQGYIIAYGGRRARLNEAQERGERAKDYLVRTRGIPPARIVVIDGGFREELTVELSIVPTGVHPPAASPTVEPSEVEIITDPKTERGRNPRPR